MTTQPLGIQGQETGITPANEFKRLPLLTPEIARQTITQLPPYLRKHKTIQDMGYESEIQARDMWLDSVRLKKNRTKQEIVRSIRKFEKDTGITIQSIGLVRHKAKSSDGETVTEILQIPMTTDILEKREVQ